ncbi:MAG: hypothetical protein OEY86_01630 [Nitrospira sp.]|nr:hypothetical protein [Nitrospira sp.]
MTERIAYRPVNTVGACLIVIVTVLGGAVMVEAADPTVKPSSSTTTDALKKKKTGKAQGKSNVQPTKRRQSKSKGTATVTPMEPGKDGNKPAASVRNQDSVGPTAAPIIVPAPSDADHVSPVHRYGSMDREKAVITGQASEENRAVPVGNEQLSPYSNRAAGMASSITMEGQGVQQMPAAILKQFIELLERNEQLPDEMSNSDLYKGNRVFFRGGYVGMMSDRKGEIFTDTLTRTNPADKGYYVGAGLDLLLARNLWGLLKGASVFGEINVEYKWLQSARTTVAAPALLGDTTPNKVNVTMLTVSVAPKLKFNEGKAFRPWIIPAGLDVHVISPPSNRTQYLDVGVQFAAGFEYQVWREFKVGVEGRYHLAANHTQTVNSFWNAGPYVSIGF